MNRHKVPLTPYSAILPIAWVDLSTYCNAGCPQCHRTDRTTGKKVEWLPLIQWSLECFKRRFDYMGSISGFEFCGTWGDPVMNKDLLEICRYIIENSSAHIQINTNGSIRDESWWWELGSVGRERLKVVFDVSFPEVSFKVSLSEVLLAVLLILVFLVGFIADTFSEVSSAILLKVFNSSISSSPILLISFISFIS